MLLHRSLECVSILLGLRDQYSNPLCMLTLFRVCLLSQCAHFFTIFYVSFAPILPDQTNKCSKFKYIRLRPTECELPSDFITYS